MTEFYDTDFVLQCFRLNLKTFTGDCAELSKPHLQSMLARSQSYFTDIQKK